MDCQDKIYSEEYEDYIVVKDCPSYVIQDYLKPLQEGEKVRLIK